MLLDTNFRRSLVHKRELDSSFWNPLPAFCDVMSVKDLGKGCEAAACSISVRWLREKVYSGLGRKH